MRFASALYAGVVTHSRARPRKHALRYRIFTLLIDLDELPLLDRALAPFSYNRPNLLSFHDRDHGDGSGAPLRPQVERILRAGGVHIDGGPIRLLSMPRVLGYVFNPLSVYFCHRPGGELAALLYEVNNTFGQRHSYIIPVEAGAGPIVKQSCAKTFHVSPFMDMDMTYDFRVVAPAEAAVIAMQVSDPAGPMLSATFAGKRERLTTAGLLKAWLAHPLLTLKVIAGIHWEALKLLAKGVKLRPAVAEPNAPVTYVVAGALEAAVSLPPRPREPSPRPDPAVGSTARGPNPAAPRRGAGGGRRLHS